MAAKNSVAELAVFSGKPLFPSFIHVGRPNLGSAEVFNTFVKQIWDTKVLANNGPIAQEFEAELARYLGVKHVLVVCNGTVALELAARALSLRGEVIVPSFTFIATAHCLKWQEITPVFCDVDPVTHTIDPKQLERLITPNTTGILGVHLWGQPCQIEQLQEVATKHNIKLFFDAAHAFGCSYKGNKIGNFGNCEVFSFHATKFFNACEGGAIATNDDELARKIKLMRNFGFVGYDNVQHIGTNGKMIELSAAMGLTNLSNVPSFVARNRENYEAYRAGLANVPGIEMFQFNHNGCEYNYQYVVLLVDEKRFGIRRDQLVCLLTAENLSARRYFYPGCHRMQPYKALFPNAHLLLPITEKLCDQVICVPTGTSISSDQIKAACELIHWVQLHAQELTTCPDNIEPSPQQLARK